MAKHINSQVLTNYTDYLTLKNDSKATLINPINVNLPSNNRNYLEREVDVEHNKRINSIVLIVTVNRNNYEHHQFKLRCQPFCPEPFFRYDSDGMAHRNYSEDVPLEEQQITTPHFHYFDSRGINIAYKTKPLVEQTETMKDINLAFSHFCQEAILCLNFIENEFSEIVILPGSLDFQINEQDPTAGVNFA